MRFTRARAMQWLLLQGTWVGCGGSPAASEAAAPSERPTSAASTLRAPAPPPSVPAVAAAPPFPPAPWAIAAAAPNARRFLRYELGGATVWAACYVDAASGGCLQPELAIERADRLEPTDALAPGMPKLEYIDLRGEPEGHWKAIGHKAHRPRASSCADETYVGPRAMTGLYGRFPDDVWMTVDRGGEEPAMTSVTSVLRFRGKQWHLVRTQPRLGERVARLFRWRAGMLGLVERHGMPVRFETFGTPPGVVAPRIPRNTTFTDIVVRDDQSLVATATQQLVTLVGWAPRAAQPVPITLRATLHTDGDDTGKVVVTPSGDVDVFGFGEIPIEAEAKDGFASDKLRAKLRFDSGRWEVVEQKRDDWQATGDSSEPPALAALRADERFSIVDALAAPGGSRWVAGSADGRALLLRDRAIEQVWRTSESELAQVPAKVDPRCDPDNTTP